MYAFELLDMKVIKYAKTGGFAPSSWLCVLKEDDEYARITYRDRNFKVVKGEVPLPNHPSSEVIYNETKVIPDGSMSRIDESEMERILVNDTYLNMNSADKVDRRDNDIEDVRNNMSEYLNNTGDY